MLRNHNVKIIIDNRENKNRIPNLLEKKCLIEMKQLPIGDFILSEDVCIERKTVCDFISSVINRRVFDQMTAMKDAYPCPVLIIEGDDSITEACESTKINPNAMNGALASIALNYQIPVLHTHNQKETADLLYTIARREQEDQRKGTSIRQKKGRSDNERQEFLIAGLPSIDKTIAVRLLTHFKTPSNVFAASLEDLQKVEGIGKEKARKMQEILDREYEESVL